MFLTSPFIDQAIALIENLADAERVSERNCDFSPTDSLAFRCGSWPLPHIKMRPTSLTGCALSCPMSVPPPLRRAVPAR